MSAEGFESKSGCGESRGVCEAVGAGGRKRVLTMKGGDKRGRMNPYYRRGGAGSGEQGEGGEEKGSSVLRQAIRRGDLSYISEFLASRERGKMAAGLSWEDKEALGTLVLEFVDQPLRNEALEVMREIVSSIRDVGVFVSRLKERALDFGKLVHLKGRIDYLRFTIGAEKEKEAETTVSG